jgi:hypothetical protein
MKKFAVIAVLAVLAATGLSHKAMAWCKFNFSCGCNICFEKGGESCTSLTFSKTHHDGCGPGGCAGGVTYGYPSDWVGRGHAEPAAAPLPSRPDDEKAAFPPKPKPADEKPAFPPKPKPADERPNDGNQPVGYWGPGYQYVPSSPSTGYTFYPQGGYGGAPSYWYGR